MLGRRRCLIGETIGKKVEVEGKFVQQTGGHGQFGHVWITRSHLKVKSR